MQHSIVLRRSVLGLTFAALGAGAGACSSTTAAEAVAGCDGLDATVQAEATMHAYSEATVKLRDRALEVEAQFAAACNAMNADLGLDASNDSAEAACGILRARIDDAARAGVSVLVEVTFDCSADLQARADCEAECNVEADCDIEASCRGGEVVVNCGGACNGQCDISAPEIACLGTCEGTCSGVVDVECSGVCEGSCSAPEFDGTCETGCSAGFNGSCEGSCEGTCDGTSVSGECQGLCEGTCSGRASGTCQAACEGQFSDGHCEGECTGSCSASAGVDCDGTCQGTCVYKEPTPNCQGTCHGECDAELSPPVCTGELDCEGSAECSSSCEAEASADIDCPPPTASVIVLGDVELQQALSANIEAWGEAVNLTLALREPIADVASKTLAAFEAVGEVGAAGATCFASSLSAAVQAEASISVSVEASASLSAEAE
jgi:hypothetical protein